MPLSSNKNQKHSEVSGINFGYETVELVLASIPNFKVKHKAKILHLFTEIYNTFVQEIQDALDERQNLNVNLARNNRVNQSVDDSFNHETQLQTDSQPVDLSAKSFDESFENTSKAENTFSNETFPVLAAAEKENSISHEFKYRYEMDDERSQQSSMIIKREATTPKKTSRQTSKTSTVNKRKHDSKNTSLSQLTMTQLFDPIESPRSSLNDTIVKNEPKTPGDDTMLNMPESLIGLAEQSTSPFNYHGYENNISDITLPLRPMKSDRSQSFKRKSTHLDTISNDIPDQIDDENDSSYQNQALIETPHSAIDTEELLYACPMCRNYWLGLPAELRNKNGLTCRHRQKPVARSPEHFWSLGIPNTQICIERGYGGVLPPEKPIQRPRRPRRQHQRILKEKQQLTRNSHNDHDDDSN